MRIVVTHGLGANAVSARKAVGKQAENMEASCKFAGQSRQAPLVAASRKPSASGGTMKEPDATCGLVVGAPTGVVEGSARAESKTKIVGES